MLLLLTLSKQMIAALVSFFKKNFAQNYFSKIFNYFTVDDNFLCNSSGKLLRKRRT